MSWVDSGYGRGFEFSNPCPTRARDAGVTGWSRVGVRDVTVQPHPKLHDNIDDKGVERWRLVLLLRFWVAEGLAKITTGPNNASGVVWTRCVFFLCFYMFFHLFLL